MLLKLVFLFATVSLDLLEFTVTRWWIGAPAIHVRMVPHVHKMEPPSSAPVQLDGLARFVM